MHSLVSKNAHSLQKVPTQKTIKPLVSIDDICIILRSMCQASMQEMQGFPTEQSLDEFDLPLTSFLVNRAKAIDTAETTSSAQTLASALCTMFSCKHLIKELKPQQSLKYWATMVYKVWSISPTHIVFATSGSTGTAVYQCHHVAFLEQEAKVLAHYLVDNRKRIVASAPAHHIYGFLFTLLLPKFAKLPVIYPPVFPTAEYTKHLKAGDLIISFPFFWQALIALEVQIGEDIHGISSTSPCPPAILKAITHLGIESIINIYGSSETGGIGFQKGAEAPFTLFPFWQKSGVTDSTIQRKLPKNAPTTPFATPQGTLCLPFWEKIQLPDKTQWINETNFIIQGRHDTIVQVGGKNVSLTRTQQCLQSHPLVQHCAVRLMRPEEGKRLKCFCVLSCPKSEEEQVKKELFSLCRKHLTAPERPKKIHFGTELPTNALGKLQDW